MRDYIVDFNMNDISIELEALVCDIKRIKGVLAVYVFGSYVKGEMHGLSDVDISIIGNVSSKHKTDILLGRFPEVFHMNFFEDLPIWMKARILRDGKCLLIKDEESLNLIKLMVLGEYLDFKPVIDDIVERELAQNV